LSSIIAAKGLKKQKNYGGPFKWNKKSRKRPAILCPEPLALFRARDGGGGGN
jgi:hypothetical protein